MTPSIYRAALLGALLSLPASAADRGDREGSLPSYTTGQASPRAGARDRSGAQQKSDIREAPSPTKPGVVPGREPSQAPGAPFGPAVPGRGAPEAGQRWGLIVFVIAIVGLALLAFRRRGPPPPSV